MVPVELVMNYYRNILQDWKHHRFLKKHGCSTQREYDLKYDVDYNPRASRIKQIYHGYEYIYFVPNSYAPVQTFSYLDRVREAKQWCDNNCKGKYRNDWHRGFYDSYYDDFIINGIGGGDYMVFAFKSKEDYVWFMLSCSEI